jgi:hypothetical protein
MKNDIFLKYDELILTVLSDWERPVFDKEKLLSILKKAQDLQQKYVFAWKKAEADIEKLGIPFQAVTTNDLLTYVISSKEVEFNFSTVNLFSSPITSIEELANAIVNAKPKMILLEMNMPIDIWNDGTSKLYREKHLELNTNKNIKPNATMIPVLLHVPSGAICQRVQALITEMESEIKSLKPQKKKKETLTKNDITKAKTIAKEFGIDL